MLEGFVPPIFDYSVPDGYFRRREAEISAMPDGIAKGRESARLQDWLFSRYEVLNARGERLSVKRIFARRGLVPPGGTGDCAAPKLLQYAYLHGMKPLAMGEFWYGASHSSEVREHGHFYPACFGKCGPLLSFMMEGLDVEPNPLDREYEGREPAVLHADSSIIVVDKPAGMLSVPGRNGISSLLDWLAERYGEVHSCHRLDMDTSGIMVYARNIPCKAALEAQFAGREVSKTYRARLSAGSSPFRRSASGTIAPPPLARLLRQAPADCGQELRQAGDKRIQGPGDAAGRRNRHTFPSADRQDAPAQGTRGASFRARQADKGRPALRRHASRQALPSRRIAELRASHERREADFQDGIGFLISDILLLDKDIGTLVIMYKSIEICAGAGWQALGLELAGFSM